MTNSNAHQPRVTVAVLTYQRVGYLPNLMSDLRHEAELASKGLGRRLRVLVVDNDPEASAHDAVHNAGTTNLITYVVEPKRGIAAARNRALRECSTDDVIVFLDDDERPDRGWLDRLLSTYDQYESAAVAGPVRTLQTGPADPWATAGRFVDRSHRQGLQTGATITEAATNNLLLDLETVRNLGLRFDESLGLSSGEDSLFTRQLTAAGGRIVWCADAWVTDLRPAERTTKRALLRRAYSFSNARVTVNLKLADGAVRRVAARGLAVGTGMAQVGTGVVYLAAGLIGRSMRWRANGARLIARGLGAISAGVGFRYEEYAARPSGPTS